MLKNWTRVVLLTLVCPGEVAVLDLVRASGPLGQITRPVVHQDTPSLEQVGAGMGRLHPVPDHMRQGRLDHLPGMVSLLTCPVPEGRAEPVRHRRNPKLSTTIRGAGCKPMEPPRAD